MSKQNQTKIDCPQGREACPIYSDIEKIKAELEELSSQVIRDFLTGLYNPRHLDFSLNQELERTLRSKQPTTMIMLDIDHFKSVNDTYGHAAGDIVIKHVSKILENSVRKLDVCCRYGGEEFAIILPSTHQLVGIQVAERIRSFIEETSFELTEGEIKVTASFGVNTFHYNCGLSQQAFIESVDGLLYSAKKAGRNQVCSSPQADNKTLHVSSDERSALFGSNTEED